MDGNAGSRGWQADTELKRFIYVDFACAKAHGLEMVFSVPSVPLW